MTWRIGVDIGGTFTDVALVEEETGRIGIAKVPTTPRDFAEGVLNGLKEAVDRYGIAAADVSLLAHATTIVTNALLERKGARTAFVSTKGFRDILEIRRSARTELYNLFQDAPPVLVPRRNRFEISGRIDAQGAVVEPLDESAIPALIEAIKASDVQTVGVSLMFSFLNPAHEMRLGELLRAGLPGMQVFLSCEVLPEIREFERASTTAVCAYVGPLLEGYLLRLQDAVATIGMPPLHVMSSSGGVLDIRECLRMPAVVVESGPAAGVIAAQLAGRQLGLPNVLSFDMGGTTAKASVIADGEITVTADYEVGGAANAKRWANGTGHPIRVPVIDLAEVSAGGGSIAWLDPAGALKVGPHSAGALPGPASYGRGGTLPTVTDANVILGYLASEALLDGALKIDRAAAETAMMTHVAAPLGLSVSEAASRIIEIVNANMYQALRLVSVERGYDPQEFTLMAFGGAGAIHAAALADELDIQRVVIPPIPGAFSALGLVASDLKRDYARTFYADLRASTPDQIGAAFAGLEAEAATMLDTANVEPGSRALVRYADLRYRRQAYELTIPMAAGPITAESLTELARSFNRRHMQTYGHMNEAEPIQIVNLRLTAIGRFPKLELRQHFDQASDRRRQRDVWFPATGSIACPVLWREGLVAGFTLAGPAVVESLDSTIVIPPGWSAEVEARGYLILRKA